MLHVHPPWLHQHRSVLVLVHDRQARLSSRRLYRPSPFAQIFRTNKKNSLKMEA
jgi:hypothetical protein